MKITENIFAAVPLPEDAKLANIIMNGNSVIVETIPEYLSRVFMFSRYLSMEVAILSPAGTYEVNDFIGRVNLDIITSKKYWFKNGIENHDLVPKGCGCDRIVSRWVPTGVKSCILDEDGRNTGIQLIEKKEQTQTNEEPWEDSNTPYITEEVQNIIDCPVPGLEIKWVEISRACELNDDNKNTGWQIVIEKEQSKIGSDEWTDTETPNRTNKVQNLIDCPVPSLSFQWVEISRSCELNEYGQNTGWQLIVEKEQSKLGNDPWIDTISSNRTRTVQNVIDCKLPDILTRTIYGEWSCVKESETYNTGYKIRSVTKQKSINNGTTWTNESITSEQSYDTNNCPVIPYRAAISVDKVTFNPIYAQELSYKQGSAMLGNTPVKPGINYLFVSIPSNKTNFLIQDGTRLDITSDFTAVGPDPTNSSGFRSNTIYRSSDGFNTANYTAKIYLTIW